ncbi:hypothetical protein [Candidatus Electrothrix sp.]|uniref:hypothetical protein n=1 Tax=Candidatus Electrothrix sp. TaxID=2170559 RepID=UPI004055E32C
MGTYQLKSIKDVFSEAWDLYTSRVISIFLVALLALLLSIIILASGGAAAFISLGGQPFFAGDLKEILLNPIVVGTGALLFLLTILLISWCHAATLTVTVRDEISIGKGLITSWKYVFPLLWITSLYIGIIIAGLTFFILPGLILSLSMSLCFCIMIKEDRPGIDAILASRFYIRGHWWNTFIKLLPIGIVLCLLSLIPGAGPVLSLLFSPFLLLAMVSIYHDLKECAEDGEPPTSTGWLWVLFGVFGFLLPLLAFVGTIVALGPQLPEIITQVQKEVNTTLGKDIFPQSQPDTKKPIDEKTTKPPIVRQLPSVDGLLIWRDPIGDAHNPLLDVKEVSAKGDQGELILTTTMTRPLDSYFLTVEEGDIDSLISFYLDTDIDRTTGGTPFGQQQKRKGYDIDVQVRIVAQQEEDNTVSGGLKVSLYQIDNHKRQPLGKQHKNAVTVSGDTVTVRLPYYQLGIEPDSTIRICYREADQEQGRGLAKDKLIPLH